MGFDSSGKYTFSSLESKYNAFIAPEFQIKIGGAKLDSIQVPISGLEISIDLEKIGYARFTIESLYDYEKSTWVSDLIADINVGQKVAIEVGYSAKRKRVFFGYVDSFTVNYSSGASPSISVTALDARALLNNDNREIDFGNLTYKDAIKQLIDNSDQDKLIEKVTLDMVYDEQEHSPIKDKCSAYKFLSKMAQLCSCNFCIIDGELLFKNLMQNSASLITLTMGSSLSSFTRTIGLSNSMAGAVVVKSTGNEQTKKIITGEADSIEGSGGQLASELVKSIGKSTVEFQINSVTTKEECTKIAKAILATLNFGLLEADAECIGIPEMTPGRFITLEGLDKRSNGSYFVTSVTHSFSSDGYVNKIHMKGFRSK